MKFKPTPIKFEKGQVVTSLYHSPFDLNLFYLICLGKTGLKLKIILDDIDNVGIDKSGMFPPRYRFGERYYVSKTERTNIRPLSLITPKHLLANLSYPDLKMLDSKIGIVSIKKHFNYTDTVEHWIKDTTNNFGSLSLIGPDRAFAFSVIDRDFIQAVKEAKNNIISILKKFPEQKNMATDFINWLLDENIVAIGMTVSDYYALLLQKIITRFGLKDNVTVQKMSDQGIQTNTVCMLDSFNNEKSLRETYKNALAVEERKRFEDFPFYAISKKTGKRLLPVNDYIRNKDDYLLAPKVLMLNNFENLVLPYHAINSKNVWAREIMYQNKVVACNQVFCDDKWVSMISAFALNIELDQVERQINDSDILNTSILSHLLIKGQKMYENGLTEEKYKGWIITSTIKAIDRAKYPLIFMALLQEKVFFTNIPDFYKLTSC